MIRTGSATFRIGTHLPLDSFAKLRTADLAGHTVMAAKSPGSLSSMIQAGDCQIVVIDPMGVRDDAFDAIAIEAKTARIPLVVWTQVTRLVIPHILCASRLAPVTLLIRDCDDQEVLRAILHSATSLTARALMLHTIAPRLDALPRDTAVAVVTLFSSTAVPSDVEEFAIRARWHARTIERQFRAAGICSPADALRVARIARCWEPLQTNTVSLADVARFAGCNSAKDLAVQFASVVNLPPRRAIRLLTLADFVSRLITGFDSQDDR